jgi:hypothetical protein
LLEDVGGMKFREKSLQDRWEAPAAIQKRSWDTMHMGRFVSKLMGLKRLFMKQIIV